MLDMLSTFAHLVTINDYGSYLSRDAIYQRS